MTRNFPVLAGAWKVSGSGPSGNFSAMFLVTTQLHPHLYLFQPVTPPEN